MSFNDYANYIIQKYRVNTAIAVINTKPEDISTEDYINELKSKINEMNDDVDSDVTVCSDDFNLDDDLTNVSDTVLKYYENDSRFDDIIDNVDANIPEIQQPIPTINDDSQRTYYEETEAHCAPQNDLIIDNDATYCENVEQEIPKYHIGSGTVSKDNDPYDSQKTILYTVHGFTDYSHVSQSQNNIDIPNKYLYGVDKNGDLKDNRFVEIIDERNNISHSNNENSKIATEIQTNMDDDMNLFLTTQGVNSISNNIDVLHNLNATFDSTNNNDFNNRLTDKEITNPVVNMDLTQNCKNTVVPKINNTPTNEIIKINKEMTSLLNNSQNMDLFPSELEISQNINNYIDDTINHFNNKTIENVEITHNCKNTVEPEINNIPTNEINKEMTTILDKSQNMDLFPSIPENAENINNYIDDTINHFNNKTIENVEIAKKVTQTLDINNKSNLSSKTNNVGESIEIEVPTEIIPFKILEEFNKVQMYLNKHERRMSTDGFSSDSGYRSDSQSRSSNRSALQLSGNWLNQSGHCLFNHVMTCQLLVSTRDITDDIAEVLGQLIDKLHEEELYPSFLEELLEASDLLLRQLNEELDVDNMLLKRDENIQRLILLNKSVHIQKYCIEKITNILTDYHRTITDSDGILELTNINQLENLTYIFHLLEILLRIYDKNKNISRQTSVKSDDLIKKSSITDIWKRKWNPSNKDGDVVCSVEKKCILTECSNILNKIIVDCLKSYSLVSYAALKCFNILQS